MDPLHLDNPHSSFVESPANPQNTPQDSRWPTMITAGIRCPMCPPEVAALLDEGQLERQHALAFVQLNPCGHLYCTRCFELLLRASAQRRTRAFIVLRSIPAFLFFIFFIICFKLLLAPFLICFFVLSYRFPITYIYSYQ